MALDWSPPELERIGAAEELEIAARSPDGTLRRWTPVWVVCAGGHVYVRTWYRRDSGWFGRVLESGRARVRVRGMEADVTAEDVGGGPAELRAGVDAAYRAKYGSYGAASVDRMVGPDAAATTLRLVPVGGAPARDGG